jgi:hypothetical protein
MTDNCVTNDYGEIIANLAGFLWLQKHEEVIEGDEEE